MANRRTKPLRDLDPAQRTVLPQGFYLDSLQPAPKRIFPNVPLHATRIDFHLEPAEEMQTVDFYIPEEPAIWEAWAAMRVKREALDAELTGFSECVILEGATADIRRISHKTRRVMESQTKLFRFAIDHDIDSMAPEPVPIRVPEMYNPTPDRIRESAAAARRAGVNQPRIEPPAKRTQFPWVYVSGLVSAVALLSMAKLFHLT